MPIISPSSTFDIIYSSEKYDFDLDLITSKKTLLPPKINELHWLPIISVQVLADGDDVHKVIELTLSNQASSFDFEPGDTIGILPENNITEVELLLDIINATSVSDCKYTLIYNDDDKKIKSHLPDIGSLKYVFQHFIDIRRVLSKHIVSDLAQYTNDSIEKRAIENICTEKGSYSENILNKNVNILDFLKLFPSCRPTATFLLQQLPKLMPRPYTICNSPKQFKDVIKICFSVVRHNNGTNGLTTGMLENLTNNLTPNPYNIDSLINDFEKSVLTSESKSIEIPVFFKPSIFHLPIDHTVPIIMICNGTGIAPFIGFLEERQFLRKENLGISRLYFGCRYSDQDFLYKKQLEEFLADGTLSELVTAHSRQDENCKYVQDKLLLDTEIISNLINASATIYVCGSNKMVKQVELYFINLFKNADDISVSEAKAIVKNMKLKNKYIIDVWL